MYPTRTKSGFACSAALVLTLLCGRATAADALLWFKADRPGAQALQAVDLLLAAADDGLVPADYQAGALQQAVQRATQGPPPAAGQAEALDRALTEAVQHYLSDLHRGRIDPALVHQDFTPPDRNGFDAAALLKAAVSKARLPALAREAAPQLPAYERLREVLAQYRKLVGHPAWQQPLPPLPVPQRGRPGKLEPGQAYQGLPALAQRLAAFGDLAPGAAVPALYAEPLPGAVRAFQERHGLVADGVVGRGTLAQLEVTPAARVHQIELTLERLRWTPLLQGPRMIVINIPEFVLRAYEIDGGQIQVREQMKVIVGKALDTRTPLFDEDMRYIEFSPYWNVPPSIERSELVPQLRREPGYWIREGFEFVSPDGGVETALSSARLDAVLAGQLRIRQRPGERNALGDIKFVFPNRDNIYLHHTPATRLFERQRRDFSHGCIRVEHPVELAKFVLKGMPEWTEDRIREAMARGESATLKLAEPVPVLIAYGTALVKNGRIYFFDDLYGYDQLLDRALQQRAAAPATLKLSRHE